MLTGGKLTTEHMATLDAKKKEREVTDEQKPTVLHRYREKFLPHSSHAVLLCGSATTTANERIRQ
jgi:hypothetical protein